MTHKQTDLKTDIKVVFKESKIDKQTNRGIGRLADRDVEESCWKYRYSGDRHTRKKYIHIIW